VRFRLAASFGLGVVLLCSAAGSAAATNESAVISMKMDPLQGGLFKEAPKPVNWQIGTEITTADAEIQPMKQANLSLPDGSLTFNPDPDMAVCQDSEIGPPPTNVSITVPEAIERCPDSIIGNGTATFALAQQTSLPRDGVMIVYNGGRQQSGPLKGRPRVKIYAYSYDTGVGVYSEAALSKEGSLDFAVPQLTVDSSVTSLNLNIPGVPTQLYVESQDLTVDIPAGDDPDYAQARCATGSWRYGAEFLLGDRDTLNQPTSPTTILNETAVEPCSGANGKAKLASLKVTGPGSVETGKKGTYKVTLKNTGTATARSVRLEVTGKGVSGKAGGGNIAPGKSRTVTVKVKFARKGLARVSFKATAVRTASKTGKVRINVR